MMNCVWWLLFVSTASGLLEFNPFHLFGPEATHKAHLLLLLEPTGNGPGVPRTRAFLQYSPAEKAMRKLEEEEGLDPKPRRFIFSNCKGCQFASKIYQRWRVDADDDLPMVLLFPHSREDSEGKYMLNLKGKKDPQKEISEFIRRFDAQELEPWIKSLPVPQDQDGPVLEVVGSTFRKEVLESDVSVFVMFYAPWCGFSKMLQPKLAEVARTIGKQNPHIKVAKIDHNANDHPLAAHVEIPAVPRLFLFIRGKKDQPVIYDQAKRGQTKDAMLKWLKEQIPELEASLDSTPEPTEYAEGLLGREDEI